MLKVNNKNAINLLAKKSFAANKNRNLIAVIAIAMTAILFTTLFTVGMGTVETFQHQTIRQAGGDGHAVLKYITDQQYNAVKNHSLIREISYDLMIAESVDNPEFLKRRVEMYYLDDTAMKLRFCVPTTGSKPQAENEILTDTKTLDLLGVPHKIGSKVPLNYTVKGKQVQTDFILSGYWESDPVFNAGLALVSKAYVDAHSGELVNTFKEDNSFSGVINSYIMFKNSWNMEKKLHKVISDSGYVWDNEKAPNFIASNVNWAYLSSNFTPDPTTVGAAIVATVLIIFTGYLIIYNIFQISVIKDIRFYGLLKTIGTTGKQIKRIINRQALMLSAIGIPVGLIIGFLIGRALVPVIVSTSSYDANAGVSVSLNPVIFAGSALFALVTVFVSTRKPGKVAAGVSPIEAVRYTEGGSKTGKGLKRSTNGGKIYRMALSNLGRNKLRTVLVVISMSLSLILLNTVFALSRGFDMDKFLSKSVDTDILIGHDNYFNVLERFESPEDELSESFITAVKSQPGFEEGGRLYYNIYSGQCSIDYDYRALGKYDENGIDARGFHINLAQDHKPILDLYGLEDLPLSRLEIVEGEKNKNVLMEKLKTGKYIIEGLDTDDHGNVDPDTSHFAIGDTVTINVDGESHSYELVAKAKEKFYSNTKRAGSTDFVFYLPAQEYLRVVSRPVLMTYAFNVTDEKEADMERFVKTYTEKAEPLMNYQSKQTVVKEFNDFRSMILMVGGILSFIIGLIGVLNFVNSILTSIVTRRREFAILQSVGMTGKQLGGMLCLEALYYALGTILFSLVFGIFCSLVIVQDVAGNLWFFSYKFIIWPLLAAYPVLLILAFVIPFIAYCIMIRQSIVERLRETE
jgi:putative ABC transport system permease protein